MFEKLRAAGILVNLHYIPVYHHPYYEKSGKYNRADFPNAEAYYAEAISIPMHTMLTNDEQQFVIDQIEKPIGHQNLF
jgi:dTDP-4-amino-4,6-dideoxygalactose transaminase